MRRLTRLLLLPFVFVAAACSNPAAPVSEDVDDASDTPLFPEVPDFPDLPTVGDIADEEIYIDAAPDVPYEPPPLLEGIDALALVNPFIGTGGVAFGYAALTPAVQRPSGFVKVGPDTTNNGFHAAQNHFSGYNFDDGDVRGFSHTRLVGTGAADLGNLRVLPVAQVSATPWSQIAAMEKSSEQARPGYYAVELPEEAVRVELSAGLFSAVHRYTFSGESAALIIDPASSITDEATTLASIAVDGTSISGSVDFRGGFTGRARGFTLFFEIECSAAPVGVRVWDDGGIREGTEATGARAGVLLDFGSTAEVELRVGLSLVDAAGALNNRALEVDGKSFEEVEAAARDAWLSVLGRVRIGGGTSRHQEMFYSALYNAYRMPSQLSELDGRYRGHDLEVHTVEEGRYVSDLSLWDTYRTLHPWYSLTDWEIQADSMRSLLLMAEQDGGRVPRWPSMLGDTGSMIGSSADIVFGDAAVKEVPGVDWNRAFDVLYASAYGNRRRELGREGYADYVRLGYLPSDVHDDAVSKTLEYAWDDFGLAAVALAANRAPEHSTLRQRARNYMLLYEPTRGLFWPRTEAGFEPGGDPLLVHMGNGPFTEGSAWHWAFYFYHDQEPYIAAVGAEALEERLDTLFERSSLGEPGRPNNALPGSYYWHGNEPMIHAALTYNAAGNPSKAAYWVRQIQERLYDNTPAGLPGNDDGGTMSAWYLFTSIGLFPVAGAGYYYVLPPLFDRVEVDLPDGTTLTINTPNASFENYLTSNSSIDGSFLGPTVGHYLLSGATIEHGVGAPVTGEVVP